MDEGIKRKLVGAAALVVVGIIVYPLISPQTKQAYHLQNSVPPMPEVPDMSMPAPKALTIDVSELITEKQTPPKTIDVEPIAVDDVATPKTQIDLPAKLNTGQAALWQIQVASFSKLENAIALRDKLRANGYTAFEQLAKDGVHTRVFVGPSYQKSELDAQAKQIAKAYNLQVKIIPLQPRK